MIQERGRSMPLCTVQVHGSRDVGVIEPMEDLEGLKMAGAVCKECPLVPVSRVRRVVEGICGGLSTLDITHLIRPPPLSVR